MTTYLQAVNATLRRLREDEVSTVTQTAYSKMIGEYINDAKQAVEDAFNWNVLETTVILPTVGGTTNYVVTGSGYRMKNVCVNNVTSRNKVNNVPIGWIQDQQQLSQVQSGQPVYYAWNGSNGTDTKVEVYPTPDAVYSLYFNMNVPQVALSADADVILVPSEPVILGAFARALVERGEDGALSSSEAYALYKGVLGDAIAIESSQFVENETWVAT